MAESTLKYQIIRVNYDAIENEDFNSDEKSFEDNIKSKEVQEKIFKSDNNKFIDDALKVVSRGINFKFNTGKRKHQHCNENESQLHHECLNEEPIIFEKATADDVEKATADDDPDFYFMLLPMKALASYKFYTALSFSKFRKKTEKLYKPKPIIFITALNIFQNYHRFNEDNEKDYKERMDDYKNRMGYFNLDKRKYFLDSSIWHYYLPVEDWNGKNFIHNLATILCEINFNNKLHLYSLNVSLELLEFQSRLLRNSYLERIGGDHSRHIIPFIFHSETEMRVKANADARNFAHKFKNYDGYFKWHTLMIDDYANVNLKPLDDEKIRLSKKDIVGCILNKYEGFQVDEDESFLRDSSKRGFWMSFKLTPPKRVLDNAKCLMKKKKGFDILFLDYLLDENKYKERDLGSDLFTHEYKELSKYKGLMGKHWIFLMTAFSKAMRDKIRSMAITHIHQDWYIFDGADPISTPHLFRRNLLKLVYRQLKLAIVTKQDIIDFILDNLTMNYNNPDDTIKKPEFAQEFRLNAKRLYGIFMHRFGIKEALKQDAKNGSLFAQSVIDYYENDDEAFEAQRFYEYTRKLIFLIGYGTHEATPQMYNLFNYIVSAIPEYKDYKKKEVEGFLKAVRAYIDRLSY